MENDLFYLKRYKWEVNNISIGHNNSIDWNKMLDWANHIVNCYIRKPNLKMVFGFSIPSVRIIKIVELDIKNNFIPCWNQA